MLPENIYTSTKDGYLVYTLPLPRGIFTLPLHFPFKNLAIETPPPSSLRISHDHHWCRYGYFLDMHSVGIYKLVFLFQITAYRKYSSQEKRFLFQDLFCVCFTPLAARL